MSDTTTPAVQAAPEICDWAIMTVLRNQQADEILALNKAVLFDVLEKTGITRITVTFDGYGDSGQIEDVTALAGDDETDIPATTIEIAELAWGQAEPKHSAVQLATSIESLAYGVLARAHGGWENNEGAYGDVVFDVAERSIVLDFNERFTSSENHIHYF